MGIGTKGRDMMDVKARKFNVTISELEKVGENLGECATGIENIKKDYDNIIQNINNSWKDEAASKFIKSASDFSENELSILHKNILKEQANINTSVDKYKELK